MNQPQWITPSVAVYTTGRAEATIRAWMRAGLLTIGHCSRTSKMLVNAAEVADLARSRQHRPTRRTRPGRTLDRIA